MKKDYEGLNLDNMGRKDVIVGDIDLGKTHELSGWRSEENI